MKLSDKRKKWFSSLVNEICLSYGHESVETDPSRTPSWEKVIKILHQTKQVLFPGYFGEAGINSSNVGYYIGEILNEILYALSEEIHKAFLAIEHKNINQNKCETMARKVLDTFPRIRRSLIKDIQAAYDGDPAAKSIQEVIISYPCIEVIMIYRIAHELYFLKIPLVPRMMTEYAHAKSGIDIHPGATIGESFFIDHGTGVVIGETTIIGNHVKLYQGVTLGALSFPKDKKGKIIKGLK
ncbi:MAG: serine acetyltransferase, partial [Candidatus Aureabacteria bacterium]|nr:serine acetyltransferase [Candidatus Auribacterota bacterium]